MGHREGGIDDRPGREPVAGFCQPATLPSAWASTMVTVFDQRIRRSSQLDAQVSAAAVSKSICA
jgi:hypothetical protein